MLTTRVEIDSDINISDNEEPKYSGEAEIHEMMDVPEETITSEDLDNKSNHQLDIRKNLVSHRIKSRTCRNQ